MNGYRLELRRRLLNSHHYQKDGIYRYQKAFYVSMGFASIFAVIIAVFIAKPTIPNKVHSAFRLDSDFHIASNEPSLDQGVGTPSDNSKPDMGYQDPLEVFNPSYSKDIDEEVVRLLTEGQMKQKPMDIQPVAPSEFYAVNRFRLDNGKDVVVYTQVPLTHVSTRESY